MKNLFWMMPYDIRRFLMRIRHPNAFRHLQEMRLIDTHNGYSFKPFDQNKCIFIHIPKTAGTSVSQSLFGNLAGGHRELTVYEIVFNKSEFSTYFKFTFVRNPWDRLVSSFLYLKKGGVNDTDRLWAKQNISFFPDFDGFVKNWVNRKNIETGRHFMPQYRYVCEPGNDVPKIDFIGYFENLEEDYCYIRNILGISSNLSHFNKTTHRGKDYRIFYTDVTQEIVANTYQKDIQLFGYDFNNTSLKTHLSKHDNVGNPRSGQGRKQVNLIEIASGMQSLCM